MINLRYFYQWATPKNFYQLSDKLLPYFKFLTICFFSIGLMSGLFLAPADYQQGDAFRIIYIHVPCAIASLAIYVFMTICAAIGTIWRLKLYHMLTRSAAPIGTLLTGLALFSGSLWGKPMWGTWWIWDARLTSEFILLFLYIGYIALQKAIQNPQTAARSGAFMLFIGLIDIPIIHFSVNWWFTLHQGATLRLIGASTIAPTMRYPLFIMMVAFAFYFITQLLLKTKNEILLWESKQSWVRYQAAIAAPSGKR